MRPEVIEQLSGAVDFPTLASGVLSLCQPFGPVHSFRFIHT